MPSLSEHQVSSIREYIEKITSVIPQNGTPIWYRGVGKAKYDLLPRLYRPVNRLEALDLLKKEREIMEWFEQRSLPFTSERFSQRHWELMFFMQHYGVPTRLLDWSENPMIALLFSLSTAVDSLNSPTDQCSEPCSVWILNPSEWNRIVLQNQGGPARPLSLIDPQCAGWGSSGPTTCSQERPVAMWGTHNSNRIVAQRGAFTVFGNTLVSMNKHFIDGAFPPDCLIKINIIPNKIDEMLKDIRNFGYTDSVIYPDLFGLALESQAKFGFRR